MIQIKDNAATDYSLGLVVEGTDLCAGSVRPMTISDVVGINRGLSGIQYQEFTKSKYKRSQSELEQREDAAKRKQLPWRY